MRFGFSRRSCEMEHVKESGLFMSPCVTLKRDIRGVPARHELVTRIPQAYAHVASAARSTIFVIGPPCSGKLTFARRHFPDHALVDLHDLQSTGMSTWDSYLAARDQLIDKLKTNEKVLLRHTLMKAKRRPMYIDAVRFVLGPNARITCYYSLPDLATYHRYDLSDLASWKRNHPGAVAFPKSEQELRFYLEEFEIPQQSEGFAEVYCIQELES